jgi:hypothetical protein
VNRSRATLPRGFAARQVAKPCAEPGEAGQVAVDIPGYWVELDACWLGPRRCLGIEPWPFEDFMRLFLDIEVRPRLSREGDLRSQAELVDLNRRDEIDVNPNRIATDFIVLKRAAKKSCHIIPLL